MPLIGKSTRTKESVIIRKGSTVSAKNASKKLKNKGSNKGQSLNGYFTDSYPRNTGSINIDTPELTAEEWINALENASGMNYETVHSVIQEAEEIQLGIPLKSLEKWLPNSLIKTLAKKGGVVNLFDFQTKAFKMVLNAEDVVITAPTGAGKTEAFLLPLVARYYSEKLESKKALRMISSKSNDRSRVRVLAIYPTKALAADQMMKFDLFMGKAGFEAAIFDGDTSMSRRRKIYANPPEVIITNMDIIHHNLYKDDFRELIKDIETVIIDEIHAYEGLLGSNLKLILERLARIVQGFQIISASATVANAEEFASLIAGRTVKGCHCLQGRRTSVVHAMITGNMPINQFDGFNNTQTGQSRNKKAALMVKLFKLTGAKILAFEDSRKRAEKLHRDIAKYRTVNTAVHHGGLPAKTRRRTETAFKKGEVRILVATPTMELGIDIGDINVIFSSPVPINRLLQRFGRGGRKGQTCLTVTDLSGDTPANVYYRQYPEEFLSSASPVFFDPEAEMIIFYHVLAAARERELDEGSVFAKEYGKLIQTLLEQGLLVKTSWNSKICLKITDTGFTLLRSFNLRGIGETVNVVAKRPGTRKSTSSIITTREIGIAIQEFYPGALVLVNGQDYIVRDFDKSKRKVTVVPMPRSKKKYFTRPKVTRMIIPDKKRGMDDLMFLTDVQLVTSVESYTRTSYGSYDSRTIELDETLVHETSSRGLFIETAPVIDKQSRGYNREAWHGLGHLIVSFSTLVTGTRGFQDIEIDVTREYLLLHEMTAGGRGIARALMKALPSILEKGLTNLEACNCLNGCPKCLYIHGCREKNKGLDKHETVLLGRLFLDMISSICDS